MYKFALETRNEMSIKLFCMIYSFSDRKLKKKTILIVQNVQEKTKTDQNWDSVFYVSTRGLIIEITANFALALKSKPMP